MDEIRNDLIVLPLPPKRMPGRQSKYNFRDIPPGGEVCKVFNNTNGHKINAALSQFKRKYGGAFSTRTLGENTVGVWCLKAPRRETADPKSTASNDDRQTT